MQRQVARHMLVGVIGLVGFCGCSTQRIRAPHVDGIPVPLAWGSFDPNGVVYSGGVQVNFRCEQQNDGTWDEIKTVTRLGPPPSESEQKTGKKCQVAFGPCLCLQERTLTLPSPSNLSTEKTQKKIVPCNEWSK
jgi:hypothetical protein